MMFDYRQTRKPNGPEAKIADIVAAWLRHLDFKVVQELDRSYGVADIAALDTGDLVWIVEVKTGGQYNDAIKQLWKHTAHYKYIAKPVKKLLGCTREKLEGYGIGLIFVDGQECWVEISARHENMSKVARKRITERILGRIKERKEE